MTLKQSERHEITYRRVSRGEEDDEGRRKIDVLISEGDENTAAGSPHLSVEHRVQYGVVTLHVLTDEGKNTRVRDEGQMDGRSRARIGQISRTCTNRGLPNLRALSKFFLKASSKKLVRVIFLSLYSFMMNSVA